MLVVVDRIIDVRDKIHLEIEIIRTLRKIIPNIVLDVVVFDEESLIENLEPGALASGLAAGCKILYDELELKNHIMRTVEKLVHEEYVIQKKKRKINLTALAKARLRVLGHS